MNRIIAIAAFAALAAITAIPALAQDAGAGAEDALGNPNGVPDKTVLGGMSQSQVNKLANYIDTTNIINGKSRPIERKKTQAGQQAAAIQDKADAEGLVRQLNMPCTVANASAVAEGSATVGGRQVSTRTYEVACRSGMGYLLVSAQPAHPFGYSCFSVSAAVVADAAKGKTGDIGCQMQSDSNNAMAQAVLAGLGKSCAVKTVSWMGFSAKTQSDYTEVACTDGSGYILQTALPGAPGGVRAIGCADALKDGLRCTMTKVAAADMPITLQTFVDALHQHGIACQPTNERVIGKENVLKRHVVEFACPDHPKGLVAFIPLSDSTAKFEALDCAQARKRGIACKLSE